MIVVVVVVDVLIVVVVQSRCAPRFCTLIERASGCSLTPITQLTLALSLPLSLSVAPLLSLFLSTFCIPNQFRRPHIRQICRLVSPALFSLFVDFYTLLFSPDLKSFIGISFIEILCISMSIKFNSSKHSCVVRQRDEYF